MITIELTNEMIKIYSNVKQNSVIDTEISETDLINIIESLTGKPNIKIYFRLDHGEVSINRKILRVISDKQLKVKIDTTEQDGIMQIETDKNYITIRVFTDANWYTTLKNDEKLSTLEIRRVLNQEIKNIIDRDRYKEQLNIQSKSLKNEVRLIYKSGKEIRQINIR